MERLVVVDADSMEELAEKERALLVALPEGHSIETVFEPRHRRVFRVTS